MLQKCSISLSHDSFERGTTEPTEVTHPVGIPVGTLLPSCLAPADAMAAGAGSCNSGWPVATMPRLSAGKVTVMEGVVCLPRIGALRKMNRFIFVEECWGQNNLSSTYLWTQSMKPEAMKAKPLRACYGCLSMPLGGSLRWVRV